MTGMPFNIHSIHDDVRCQSALNPVEAHYTGNECCPRKAEVRLGWRADQDFGSTEVFGVDLCRRCLIHVMQAMIESLSDLHPLKD